MKSQAIKTLGSESFVVILALLIAIVLFAAGVGKTQQLQKGVSVQMAVTSSAAPMPAADNADAWIITVAADGSTYFGIDPVTPSGLAEKMKTRPRERDQKLYIKADARAPFADVRRMFTAARDMTFNGAVLLTSQIDSPAPGSVIAPKGLEVQFAPHSNAATVVVQIDSDLTLEVNDQKIHAADLQDTLKLLLQNRSDTPVLVKTHGPVAFAPVAQAIDKCRAIGAPVMISTPEL